jgi:hypothetical protein
MAIVQNANSFAFCTLNGHDSILEYAQDAFQIAWADQTQSRILQSGPGEGDAFPALARGIEPAPAPPP